MLAPQKSVFFIAEFRATVSTATGRVPNASIMTFFTPVIRRTPSKVRRVFVQSSGPGRTADHVRGGAVRVPDSLSRGPACTWAVACIAQRLCTFGEAAEVLAGMQVGVTERGCETGHVARIGRVEQGEVVAALGA